MSDDIKRLEIDKVWTGDGFGQAEAILLHQLKRQGNCAIYSFSKVKTPAKIQCWEVFRFKTILKGTPLPGGAVVEQSYEQYPGSNMFGKSAWSVHSLACAEAMMEDLLKEDEAKVAQAESDAANGIVTKRRGRPKKVV
jgi:hypothetical protein